MFQRQYILTIAVGMLFGISQVQSAEAGFIAAEAGSVSASQLLNFEGVNAVSSALGKTENVPVDPDESHLIKSLLAQPVGSGGNGASAGGTSVSGFGSGAAPAAIMDAKALCKSLLFSYLTEDPELKISPPFSDGIFRPPIG